MSPHLVLAGATAPESWHPDGSQLESLPPPPLLHSFQTQVSGLLWILAPAASEPQGLGLPLKQVLYWVLPPRTRGLLVSFTLNPLEE